MGHLFCKEEIRLPLYIMFERVTCLAVKAILPCGPLCKHIPDKIRNATCRTDQLSGRSQVMGQFRLYRCKGMSGTPALLIVCNQASKMCTRKLAKNQVGVKLQNHRKLAFL